MGTKHNTALLKLEEMRRITEMRMRGYELVTVKFVQKYIKGAIIGEKLFDELSNAIDHGCTRMFVHRDELAEMDRKVAENKAEARKIAACARLNNRGIAYEKEGNAKLAIKTYEKNIEDDCYPAHHSFERLMVLYRKNKDYDNEMRVIRKAMRTFPPRQTEEYIVRLEKVIALKAKE